MLACAAKAVSIWIRKPVTWNKGTIPHLATRIQQERAFEMLPILADALEEGGCTDRAMLDHCRAGKPHLKYCWVAALFAAKR